MVAQWTADDVEPLGDETQNLPVSNLAAREGRTVAIVDIQDAPELEEPILGGLEQLRSLGARAVASTPILAQGRPIGVLSVHRSEPRAWSQGELTLFEAVAAECGLAIRVGRLLMENRERLGQQAALLRAAQVLSGELDLQTVLKRFVDELAQLLQADGGGLLPLRRRARECCSARRSTASTRRSSGSSSAPRAASPASRSAKGAR